MLHVPPMARAIGTKANSKTKCIDSSPRKNKGRAQNDNRICHIDRLEEVTRILPLYLLFHFLVKPRQFFRIFGGAAETRTLHDKTKSALEALPTG